MCGIAGFVDDRLSTAEAGQMITSMLESISHRGPDARDRCEHLPAVLGHNRLSILDLSPEGNQPMKFDDAKIIFNGEVYNYIEIRKELADKGYKFHTGTDTEVIVTAYRHYGEDCVKRFNGMWSFAIWDLRESKLFCSRDRFGIKPFHFIFSSGRFYFASEYRALKKSPLFVNRANINQINRGLQLGWNAYADESYFECIQTLPPASNLVLKNGKLEISKYWDIQDSSSIAGTFEEKKERFRELFTHSIRLHMRSDVEVGGCLSGGLDSSAIASVVSKEFPQLAFKTFTVYYDGQGDVDERPWVNEVLNAYPNLVSHTLRPDDDMIAGGFDRALDFAEVPVAGSSPISQYFVMQLAASYKMKVLLDGQGSDEYLGGYMHSFYRLLGGHFRRLDVGGLSTQLIRHAKTQEMKAGRTLGTLLKGVLAGTVSEQKLYETEYRNYFPFLPKEERISFRLGNPRFTPLKNFFYHLLFTTSLPTLLQYEDRNSMAFSIESRVPFLDYRLVEFAFRLNDSDLIDRGETKRILRHSLKGILPEKIASRKDKKGFVTPGEVKWLRGPLKHLIDQDLTSLDFLDQSRVKKVIGDFKKGENKNANLVWRLVVLGYWMKRNSLI